MVEIQNLQKKTNIKNSDGSWKTKAQVMYDIALHTNIVYVDHLVYSVNKTYNELLTSGIIQEEK